MNKSSHTKQNSTSVWRDFTFRITIVVLLFVMGLFVCLYLNNKRLIEAEYLARARAHFNNIVLTRRWSAQYGGVYVEKKPGMRSSPYLINPDIQDVHGKTYTLKNPALMTREISALADKDGLYQFHITSLKPLNPDNSVDDFERNALLSFERGKKESTEMITQGDKTVYRFMSPLVAEKPCLKCHAVQGYKGGEVRGGISVSFEVTDSVRNLKQQKYILLGLFVVTASFLLGIIYQLIRRLNKNVIEVQNKLQIKSEELQKTNTKLTETLDEIKTLEAILSICAGCKKIRDDDGTWIQMEVYVHDHTGSEFSHGLCPDCIKELYPEEYKKLIKNGKLK